MDSQVNASQRKFAKRELASFFTNCDGRPHGFTASRLASSRKSQKEKKAVNFTHIQLACDQLVSTDPCRLALGGPTVKNLRYLACEFELDQNQRKAHASRCQTKRKLNASSTLNCVDWRETPLKWILRYKVNSGINQLTGWSKSEKPSLRQCTQLSYEQRHWSIRTGPRGTKISWERTSLGRFCCPPCHLEMVCALQAVMLLLYFPCWRENLAEELEKLKIKSQTLWTYLWCNHSHVILVLGSDRDRTETESCPASELNSG